MLGRARKLLTTDDQKRLNFALYYEGIKWNTKELTIDRENTGIVSSMGLKVVVIPPIYICRGLCKINHTINYYVWHEAGGGHKALTKSKKDSRSNTWFLMKEWRQALGGKAVEKLTGQAWLGYLADRSKTKH